MTQERGRTVITKGYFLRESLLVTAIAFLGVGSALMATSLAFIGIGIALLKPRGRFRYRSGSRNFSNSHHSSWS